MNSIDKVQQKGPEGALNALDQSRDVMLTVEAASELMRADITYVAMLIDNNKLGDVFVNDAGQELVAASSVLAWIAKRDERAKNSDYRAAGVAAGMYDIPEEVYIEVLTRRDS